MARIRTIKPQFFLNEELAELSAMTRLLFVGLWTQADREGRLLDRPRRLKAEIFPYDNYDIDKGLNELFERGFILRYKVDVNATGRVSAPEQPINELAIIQILNFSKHQKIDKTNEKESELPEPCEGVVYKKTSDRLPKVEEGKGMEGNGTERRATALVGDKSPPAVAKVDYEKLCSEIAGKDVNAVVESLKLFLLKKPAFLEPYVDYWNIAVRGTNVPEVKGKNLSDGRLRKLRTRLKEEAFEFAEIIKKFRASSKLKKDSPWFSFDWVFENDKNYLKILEGNYD